VALEIVGALAPPKLTYRTVAPKSEKPPSLLSGSSLAKRRGHIPHWDVPRAFDSPGRAIAELGLDAYKRAVAEYYGNIRELGVQHAQKAHGRWVVRQCVRNFETMLRRFERHNGERGTVQGALLDPLDLYRNSFMMVDIAHVLKRWQVREDLREACERLLRMKLESLWGVAPK
jgi:hypothetical protein